MKAPRKKLHTMLDELKEALIHQMEVSKPLAPYITGNHEERVKCDMGVDWAKGASVTVKFAVGEPEPLVFVIKTPKIGRR